MVERFVMNQKYTQWVVCFICVMLVGCSSYEKKADKLAAKNNWIKAVKMYQLASTEDPENVIVAKKLSLAKEQGADYYYSHGYRSAAMDNYSEAIEFFSLSLQLRPDEKTRLELDKAKKGRTKQKSQLLTQKGINLLNQSRLTEAYTSLLQALNYIPDNELAQNKLSEVKQKQESVTETLSEAESLLVDQKWQKAGSKYDEVLSTWSDNSVAIEGRKVVDRHLDYEKYFEMGEKELALLHWEKAFFAFTEASNRIETPEVKEKINICLPYVKSIRFVKKTKDSLQESKLTSAEEYAHQAISFNPQNTEASRLKEEILGQQKKANIYFLKANQAKENQEWESAIEFYQATLRLWSDYTLAEQGLTECQQALNQKSNYRITLHGAVILPFKPIAQTPWDGLAGGRVSGAGAFIAYLAKVSGPANAIVAEISNEILTMANRGTAAPDCYPIISVEGQRVGGEGYKDQDDYLPNWNLAIDAYNVSKLDNRIVDISIYDSDLSNNDNVGSYQIELGDLLKKEGVQNILCFSPGNIDTGILVLKISVQRF